MKQYRDFENDPLRFGYQQGAQFLERLHANHQHYVPIVDSAIYAPNPENPSDAYPPYERGLEADAFVMNPDGSIYYGAVWPGYTGLFTLSWVSVLATNAPQYSPTGWVLFSTAAVPSTGGLTSCRDGPRR